jgi:hypothetical protein
MSERMGFLPGSKNSMRRRKLMRSRGLACESAPGRPAAEGAHFSAVNLIAMAVCSGDRVQLYLLPTRTGHTVRRRLPGDALLTDVLGCGDAAHRLDVALHVLAHADLGAVLAALEGALELSDGAAVAGDGLVYASDARASPGRGRLTSVSARTSSSPTMAKATWMRSPGPTEGRCVTSTLMISWPRVGRSDVMYPAEER